MQRVAVIGMGPIGNTHAKVYRETEEARLVGVCDRIPERAQQAAKAHGVASWTDAARMLAELKPDIVSVATGGYEYSSDHYEPTVQALRAGCHVLCEKPISNDIGLATRMVQVAREEGRCFGIDFNHRFTPAARQAKAWQEAGRIGELLFVNMALWIGKFGDFETPFYHLKALNPHSVDFVRHFAGDIERVQCFAMKQGTRNIWSTQSMNLKFACGAVGHITSSYDIARGHPMERCEVAGVNGRLVVEDMWHRATLYPAETWLKEEYSNPIFGGYGQFYDTFKDRIQTFVRQVNAGVSPEEIDGSGLDGLEASRVIHAAIESLRRDGEPVYVKEVIDGC